MNVRQLYVFLLLLLIGCNTSKQRVTETGSAQNISNSTTFTLAFGSCNKPELDNQLWDDIRNTAPNVWVWGGDIIYADTENMIKMADMYAAQDSVRGYRELKQETTIIGSWDDHDYGLNDGGIEFVKKRESQQVFLDFMGVSKDSPRRQRAGIYTQHDYQLDQGKVKVIVLDTRYFRTALTKDTETKKRNKPNAYGEGSMLGAAQWQWLTKTLNESDANFNLIVSSVQFLSNEHGFECWGNFPHEVDKLKNLIAASKAKGVVVLSGDRHISEFSKTSVADIPYPLIDFTSSGLTHAYKNFTSEPNPYRVGEVVKTESFGLVTVDMKSNTILSLIHI